MTTRSALVPIDVERIELDAAQPLEHGAHAAPPACPRGRASPWCATSIRRAAARVSVMDTRVSCRREALMLKAPIPPDEPERMKALHDYGVLDTPPEPVYDDIAHVAAGVCDTPIALIALIDGTRNWFKARIGIDDDLTESPRDISFCGHAIIGRDIFVPSPRDERGEG
jgi:hypothetical protein